MQDQRTTETGTMSWQNNEGGVCDSMPWNRTFVSGPMDPKWNPHKIYCQICKCNVSIRAQGKKEILRHFSTERHLQKDQRWRYEHITIEDPSTKRPTVVVVYRWNGPYSLLSWPRWVTETTFLSFLNVSQRFNTIL